MSDRASTARPIHDQLLVGAVQRQLDRILKSPHFRTSKRAQDCLRFIVDRALEGDTERLKERCIGAEVFGRDPDYDTGTDSIVRVTVNELRKKLAQYYVHAGEETEVIIDVPAGSYMPEFLKATEAPKPIVKNGLRRVRVPLLRVMVLLLLVLLAAWAVTSLVLLHRPAADTTLTEFWSPLIRSPRPVLISIGNPLAWRRARHRDVTYYRLPDSRPPDEGASINDFVPLPDQFFGVGDAMAGMSLAVTFTKMGKAFEVRPGVDVSYADLRSYPVVFVGFSDTLHLQVVKGLRFTLAMEKNVLVNNNIRYDLPIIQDHVNPEKSWSLPGEKNGKTDSDYLLISRVLTSEMGQPFVEAAGLTNYGSRAAGEFLSNPDYLRQATALMPPDWPKRNLQIVCNVRVVGTGPTSPKVVAVHTW